VAVRAVGHDQIVVAIAIQIVDQPRCRTIAGQFDSRSAIDLTAAVEIKESVALLVVAMASRQEDVQFAIVVEVPSRDDLNAPAGRDVGIAPRIGERAAAEVRIRALCPFRCAGVRRAQGDCE